jgi:DNA-binding CsgD family transcriptional regulator
MCGVNARALVHRRPSEPDVHAVARLRGRCGCPRFDLTVREGAVLELLAAGMSTNETARALYVSHQAVTYHVGNLLAKFQCENRTGMVARAFVLGFLPLSWPPRVAATGVEHASVMCSHRMKDLGGRRTLV